MKISREIKTAVLVLTAILLLIWGYSFIKGKNLFDNSTKYYVEYSNVEGLTMSSNVTINGLVVGKVSNIDINQQNGKLLVELTMNKSMNISKSSIATIYSPGLISGKGISIDPKFEDTDYASSGDYLKGEVQLDITEKLGGQLEPLQQKVEELLKNANQMLLAINNIIDDKTQVNLKSAIAELDATLTGANQLIATTTPKLDKTMDNLNTVSSNFSELSLELNSLDIKSTFAKLDNATGSLDKIMSDVDSGKGTIGKLLKDDQMYNNLAGASKELEQLLRDLKENPKRYVHFSLFGKKAQPYQEPESDNTTNLQQQ